MSELPFPTASARNCRPTHDHPADTPSDPGRQTDNRAKARWARAAEHTAEDDARRPDAPTTWRRHPTHRPRGVCLLDRQTPGRAANCSVARSLILASAVDALL